MNTIYTAASGLAAQRQWLTTLGENMAAANSPGYLAVQSEFASFPTVAVARSGPNPSNNVGQTSWGVAFTPTLANPAQGLALSSTGRALDFGVAGPGFFAVQTQKGVAYTKDGRFFLDGTGTLVTAQGDRVLSAQGTPLHLAPGAFTVSARGVITQNGVAVGQLQLADLNGPLTSQAGNLYTGAATPDTTSAVVPGALDQSGVSITGSATAMIQAESAYQSLTTLITTENTRLGEAAKLGVMA